MEPQEKFLSDQGMRKQMKRPFPLQTLQFHIHRKALKMFQQ